MAQKFVRKPQAQKPLGTGSTDGLASQLRGKSGNTPTPLGQGTPETSGLGGGPVHIARQGPRQGQAYRILDEGGIRYHVYAKGTRIRIGPAPLMGASNPMANRG